MPSTCKRLECGCSSGVEHNLAKVRVEGSNPFARSNKQGQPQGWPFCFSAHFPLAFAGKAVSFPMTKGGIMVQFVAVIDIGKTNAKVLLMDLASGAEVVVFKTPNLVVNAPPYRILTPKRFGNLCVPA